MRVHTTSLGLDPHALAPGEDLVLAIDESHGLDLADGVFVQDHLTIEDRREIDRAALDTLDRWRAVCDERLTVDGVCLPSIWEMEAFEAIDPIVRDAVGLRAALLRHRPDLVVLADSEPRTERLVRAVAGACAVAVARADGAGPASVHAAQARSQPLVTRVRRRLLRATAWSGVPSLLRRDCTLFDTYWPLVPLLDRALSEPDLRPAVTLQRLPTGPRRSLRAARRGGWIGLPGPRDRRRGRQAAQRALSAAGAPPALDVLGLQLGECLHRGILERGAARAAADLATASMLRRVLARGRIRRVVGTSDTRNPSRVLLSLAREAGIPRLLLAHGAYLIPQTVGDMEHSEEVAVWSEAIPPPITNWSRPVHVVGYPLPQPVLPDRPPRPPGDSPRVVVLAATTAPSTAMLDPRIMLRHYVTACRTITSRIPGASVVLRPHPSDDIALMEAVLARFPDHDVRADPSTDIMALLAGADLVIGATTAASLQAALVAAPVVILNLSGFDWPWPLGGDSSVPVARNESELDECIERWARDGEIGGRADLLEGLGADGGDATERLLGAVRQLGVGEPARQRVMAS